MPSRALRRAAAMETTPLPLGLYVLRAQAAVGSPASAALRRGGAGGKAARETALPRLCKGGRRDTAEPLCAPAGPTRAHRGPFPELSPAAPCPAVAAA